jgi:hypothetical protein
VLVAEQQLLGDVENVDCVIWFFVRTFPKGVVLAGFQGLVAFADGREVSLEALGTALVVDATRQYMRLLEGKRCMCAGVDSGEEGGGTGGHRDALVLLPPGIGEVHGLIRNRTIILEVG